MDAVRREFEAAVLKAMKEGATREELETALRVAWELETYGATHA